MKRIIGSRHGVGPASALILLGILASPVMGQTRLDVKGSGFDGVLHDNVSNRHRQGNGFAPLNSELFTSANLFRDDAVGLNFEHVFNGAKAQHDISMFTPRQDPCLVSQIGKKRWQLLWPSEGSQWGLEARMVFELVSQHQIDLSFQCSPTKEIAPQGFVAMMWASYMNRALDRRIHFWGKEGDRTGWVQFGVGQGHQIEIGTLAHAEAPRLPFEEGAQTLNLIENTDKKFITPFYYGLIDGDQDLETQDDALLFLVLFDQTESIRFAMWNFFKDEKGFPDTHSPAWDWQYVIRNPDAGKKYGYRARVVVKPFEGQGQVWDEYRKWTKELKSDLPAIPDSQLSSTDGR